jgi:hypothetical protein
LLFGFAGELRFGDCTLEIRIAGQSVNGPKTAEQWFNKNAWTVATGHFGNSGRGVVDGTGFNSWDLAAINAFNHTSFREVQTAVNSGVFGRVNSTYDPRIIQLGMKLQF